jgi:hypothetical protein
MGYLRRLWVHIKGHAMCARDVDSAQLGLIVACHRYCCLCNCYRGSPGMPEYSECQCETRWRSSPPHFGAGNTMWIGLYTLSAWHLPVLVEPAESPGQSPWLCAEPAASFHREAHVLRPTWNCQQGVKNTSAATVMLGSHQPRNPAAPQRCD